jgi:hypothetical protein
MIVKKGKDLIGNIFVIGLVIYLGITYFTEEKVEPVIIPGEESSVRSLFTERQFLIQTTRKKKLTDRIRNFENDYKNKYIKIRGIVKEKKCRENYPDDHNEKCHIRTEVRVQKDVSKTKTININLYSDASNQDIINSLTKFDRVNAKCKFITIGSYYDCKFYTN